ncbi:MAG TPA: FHA domain-containing protein, partial [Bryobacteraceae bacterium]|nr:FHA domain-containing protein [Bryobacteraceae bacterium]
MQPGPIKELQILTPDGQNRFVPLNAERISLGRSSATELSFPDDNGLSRQHLALERDGDGWAIRDLGSKNGTMLNGTRVTARTRLKSGDRIAAGHLVLVYDGAGAHAQRPRKPVVVFDPREDAEEHSSSSTVITQLEGVINSDGGIDEAQLLAASHISALVRAGNELAGN